jgi:hypothetical protein
MTAVPKPPAPRHTPDPAGPDPAGPEPGDLAGVAGCGASAILARGGPTAVPFDLCCVLTLVRAGGTEPGPAVCRALEMLDVDQPLVVESAP